MRRCVEISRSFGFIKASSKQQRSPLRATLYIGVQRPLLSYSS
jgi:hypothetical protein